MLKTVEQVIEKFGGNAEFSRVVNAYPSNVTRAKKTNRFPYRWRMTVFQEAKRRRLRIAPELLGLNEMM